MTMGSLVFSYWQSQQQMSFQEKQRAKSLEDQREFDAIAHQRTLEQIGVQADAQLRVAQGTISAEVAGKQALAGPPLRRSAK
jgi:hypothetical protein